ncbi:hypothetical protein [Metapseudomonas otitidis]|uniref:hypothetical protein n=1 Tax=Metapseudomonas otitidis TaxID=319939 RepID=UPI00280B05C1|nr:hypothetical protein [Pseudomonas otitidis]
MDNNMTKETEAQPTRTKSTTTRNILVALLATLCISSLGYWALQPPQPKDAFIEALDDALRKNNRNITLLLSGYIRSGDDLDATLKFLEARGFKIYHSKSDQDKYFASKKSVRNLIIQTETLITLETDGAKILRTHGNIFLTSL